MLVLVTGGTGFVGSHTVAAVTAAGHRVRILARDAAAVDRALTPLGVASDAIEITIGDVTDQAA
ncbi:MAG TPA: NAD-dependent epimerase/dehydratase family protein, partial [Micromonospora sp.]